MDTFEASLWDEASRDVEAEASNARVAYAKMAVLDVWPFLANARSRNEYLHREAIAEDRITAAAGDDPALVIELKKALRQDFNVLHKARLATLTSDKPKTSSVDAKSAVRHLAIVMEAADDEESGSDAFYVVDEESGKDIGGPYDSHEAAQEAISGGDFDEAEGDMRVEEGPEGEQDADDAPVSADADDDGEAGTDSEDESDDLEGDDAEPGDEGDGEPLDEGDGEDAGDDEPDDEGDEPAFLKGAANEPKTVKKCVNCNNGNHTGTNGTTGCRGGNCQCACKRSAAKVALQEGEDPLAWVEQYIESGMGQPEKADEHNETQDV